MYCEDDYLLISGLQHFAFCQRQWALIHIENQWAENLRTMDGQIMHKNAHDGSFREKRGDVIITRDMRVFSAYLGITGACDVVEFHRAENGITLFGLDGTYSVFPVEYKRGSPRTDDANALQLCAQAMCLEEMLCCDIPSGALYYGEIHRRETVEFTPRLRQSVRDMLEQMHALYFRGYTPKVKPTKSCNACSLKEICLPKILRIKSARAYMAERMGDE